MGLLPPIPYSPLVLASVNSSSRMVSCDTAGTSAKKRQKSLLSCLLLDSLQSSVLSSRYQYSPLSSTFTLPLSFRLAKCLGTARFLSSSLSNSVLSHVDSDSPRSSASTSSFSVLGSSSEVSSGSLAFLGTN